MIGFLFYLLVLFLIFGSLYFFITLLPLPPNFGQIAQALLVLIFILILLGAVVGTIPVPKLFLVGP